VQLLPILTTRVAAKSGMSLRRLKLGLAVFAGTKNCHVAISDVLLAAGFGAVMMLVVLGLVLLVTDTAVTWLDQDPKGDVVVVGISTAHGAVALIPDFLFELLAALFTILEAKGAGGFSQLPFFEPAMTGAATVLTESMFGLFLEKEFSTRLTIFRFRLEWHGFLFPVAKS
jgi:hypothetical protein